MGRNSLVEYDRIDLLAAIDGDNDLTSAARSNFARLAEDQELAAYLRHVEIQSGDVQANVNFGGMSRPLGNEHG